MTAETVDTLAAIIEAAPVAATAARKVTDFTDAELKAEFETVKAAGDVLRATDASPSRNGKLAANTSRMKVIVEEARTRIAARKAAAEAAAENEGDDA